MENPWLQLPKEPPFVLPCDADVIGQFNARQRRDEFKIVLDEIPSPYIGDPESPIVFLNLNSACSPEESDSPQISQYRKIAQMNLFHQFGEYPFYVFDPSLEGTPSGYKWFYKRFSHLIHDSGKNEKELSKKIFLIEYFPYRSKNYRWKHGILPSQEYSISLVKKAIARRAIIVMMRSKKLWVNAVPELNEYPNLYILHSVRNVIISEKNLGSERFQAVIEKLNA